MPDKKTILIIGPAPENIGGISIHISRLTGMLGRTFDFDYVDEGRKRWPGRFNIRSLNLVRYINKLRRADVVHIQSGSVVLRMLNVVMAKWLMRKPTIVTVHRDPNIEPALGLTRRLLRPVDTLVCVNRLGVEALSPGRRRQTMLLPAFIPPDLDGEPQLPAAVTDYARRVKERGGRLMVSNAWRLVMKDGVDLYGLDLCVEALARLVESGSDWHLVFVVPDTTGSDEYIAGIKERAAALGVADRLMIYPRSLSFVRLMRLADAVVRPTITDGDAISVREALYYGVPVIASDVVERPQGVTLHTSRDAASLADAITAATGASTGHKPDDTDYREIYNKIYTAK